MKIKIFFLFCISLSALTVHAQSSNDSYDKAKNAFKLYKENPRVNSEKLNEALQNIEPLITLIEHNQDSEFWLLRGNIWYEIAEQTLHARLLGPVENNSAQIDDSAIEAISSFSYSLEFAMRNNEIKDALNGIVRIQKILTSLASHAFDENQFERAYTMFNGALVSHHLLKQRQVKSSLDEKSDYLEHLFVTGLAAFNAGREGDAAHLFETLYNNDYHNSFVYRALYNLKLEQGVSAEIAYQYLQAGRRINPEDPALAMLEIEHFLKLNKFNEVIPKLESAIKLMPEETNLVFTLGNVYENLYLQVQEGNKNALADEYFNNALTQYNNVLHKQPNSVDVIYSAGVLYYQKASSHIEKANTYIDDFSEEGVRNYEHQKREASVSFEHALTYFKKAESLNPNDANTLLALREIFVHQNNPILSKEFAERLAKFEAGSQLTSYFSNQ